MSIVTLDYSVYPSLVMKEFHGMHCYFRKDLRCSAGGERFYKPGWGEEEGGLVEVDLDRLEEIEVELIPHSYLEGLCNPGGTAPEQYRKLLAREDVLPMGAQLLEVLLQNPRLVPDSWVGKEEWYKSRRKLFWGSLLNEYWYAGLHHSSIIGARWFLNAEGSVECRLQEVNLRDVTYEGITAVCLPLPPKVEVETEQI